MQTRKNNGPITVTDYVVNSIRERILTGYYVAGARLDQQTLIGDLGASLIPVRESLRQLEVEGLVQIYPHRGAFVAKFSIAELQEIYQIREVLEETATQLAVPSLSAQTLDSLAELIKKMECATAAGDYTQLFDLNRAFHFAIYESSKNTLLIQMIGGLWDRSRRYRQLYTYLPRRAPQALVEHKEIYAACRAGDGATAGASVRNNVRQTTLGILEEFRRQNG
jgi:DNA-binding GntR family transcriptional regulator